MFQVSLIYLVHERLDLPSGGHDLTDQIISIRVKSGNFGHQVNLDSDLVSFMF